MVQSLKLEVLNYPVTVLEEGGGVFDALVSELVPDGSVEEHVFSYTQLGIEECRFLRSWQNIKAGSLPRVCVVYTARVTTEAQNALLKTLEELSPGTHFVFILESLASLLPTLLSRMTVIEHPLRHPMSKWVGFLGQSVGDRLDSVSELTERHKDDEAKHHQRSSALSFISQLEITLAASVSRVPIARELLLARRYLESKELGTPQVIEHLALALPVIN